MKDIKQILKRYWGYDDFRGIQQDIIQSVCAGRDTLGLMPTGGGKSITFQVPALAMEGVCIVITPLIALMKDQVQRLQQLGIFAAAIHSGLSRDEILRTLENCIFGRTKLLYVSPERLASDLFMAKVRHMRVNLITVDEAHCISQWGYDFRPSYLEIAKIRHLVDCPILALTATATPRVVDDIQERLSFREKCVFRMSFERSNLAYVVRRTDDKHSELLHILRRTSGSAIVYVRSRQQCKDLADHINQAGMNATFYHAGLEHVTKDQRQDDWQHDRVRIMVSTNAFGMGIDKPNVRIVIHYECPNSIEAYFQEAGRAGRDGQKAYAVLLYAKNDRKKIERRIADAFPPRDYIKQVYEHLACYYQIAVGDGLGVLREFDIEQFCLRFSHFPIRVHSSLVILQRAGYIDYEEEPDNQARVRFLVSRDELYTINQFTPDEDRLIVTLLRNYGGLFADYGYIDESLLADQLNLTQSQTYELLKNLSRKRLIHFIPRRNMPHIRYTQRREDMQHLHIPRHAYEERLEQHQERVQAMLRYATSTYPCRSRQLLAYFGETSSTNCQQCDVCLHHHDDLTTDDTTIAQASQQILTLLADGQPHHPNELLRLNLPSDKLRAALRELLLEEHIRQSDGLLMSN